VYELMFSGSIQHPRWHPLYSVQIANARETSVVDESMADRRLQYCTSEDTLACSGQFNLFHFICRFDGRGG